MRDYSRWEEDETDKEDVKKETKASATTQEPRANSPKISHVTPYEAYDEFQEKYEIPENDDSIFYGAAFDDFNKEWQGVDTADNNASGTSVNYLDRKADTEDGCRLHSKRSWEN